MGTNRYAYAGNDPVNMLDPGGNFQITPEMAKRLAAAGLLTQADSPILPFADVIALFAVIAILIEGNNTASGMSLTLEDEAEGFHQDEFGNIFDSNGNPTSVSDLPSQGGFGSKPDSPFSFSGFQYMHENMRMDNYSKMSTEGILDSLFEGDKQMLVDSDGLIWKGNERIKVLEQRGYDLEKLRDRLRLDNLYEREAIGEWEDD